MASVPIAKEQAEESHSPEKAYTRFQLSQRVEHFLLLISFSTLAITGLPQKYASSPAGEATLRLLGGIDSTRVIHHVAAVVLLVVSIFHILAVLYRVVVLRVSLSMLPVPQDFFHLFQDILYNLDRRKRRAYYGRYNYGEKVEYLAVVWGTVIMAITGFMMWNPIATTRFLPGQAIPAAKVAHGSEAVLAVLAIILWHFYNVHLRTFNKSIFTGEISEEEMKEEHPAELAQIQSGKSPQPPAAEIRKRREQVFFPVALVLTGVMSFGLVRFITLEQTAIQTIPPGESAPIFVPITATPSPTPLPTATPAPGAAGIGSTWNDRIGAFLEQRCGTCHVQLQSGGLSLGSYQSALQGGNSGPAVVPGDPQASMLVQVQMQGGHPGQLSEAELAAIIDWIQKGAPEQ